MILRGCEVQIDARGQELQPHGTGLLPAACYDEDVAQTPVPWHWHDELEVGVVLTGEMLLTAGSRRLTIRAGEGFFVNAGVLHSAEASECGSAVLHSIVFHPRLVGGGVDSIFWQRYLLPLTENKALEGLCLPKDEAWRAAIGNIEAAWQAADAEDFGYELTMRAALSEVVLALCRHAPARSAPLSEKALRDNGRMKQMLTYIREHFSEELTVEAIAASASVSKSECLRCFRSIVNTTPIQYVKQYRLQRAAELLRSTDLKIAEVGAECGFHEMSYFARTFREYKGCTPMEYRQT